MKKLNSFIFLIGLSFSAIAQQLPSGSFKNQYSKTSPGLNYSYDSIQKIHNYSNNWDFDGDEKTDRVLFVGTGGAHLYYYLRVGLSTDTIQHSFTLIETDFPLLPGGVRISEKELDPINNFIPFAVFDADADKLPEIFIRLDDASFFSSEKELRKNNLKSRFVLVSFKNGSFHLADYLQHSKKTN